MAIASTPKLDLLRVQETWQFGDEAFNRVIDDMDDKLVGIAHLQSPVHWSEWKEKTEYEKHDIVRWEGMKSHQYAVCLTSGISSSNADKPTNNVTGSVLRDGTVRWEIRSITQAAVNSGTIKIWLGGSDYFRGDAVRYGDALYRAKIDHTASSNFATDEDKWQQIYASIRSWKPQIYYYVDDTVIYNNLIYQCITAHVSENTFDATEEGKWVLVADTGGAKEWQTDKVYQKDQLVTYNGTLYRAKDKHTSTTDFATDTAHWDIVYASLPSWGTEVYYPAKTVVYYNNKTYKCLTAHTSGNTTLYDDGANWQILDNTIEEWATNVYYYSGQFVLKENVLYKCNTNHKASNFTTDIAKWDLVYANIQTWTTDTYYKLNSLVLHEGKLYLCTTAHTSDVFDDEVANWKIVGGGNASIAEWESDKVYEADNIVLYNNTLYRCLSNHTSGENFDPAKWQPMCANLPTWTANTVYKAGQVVIKDGQLFICNTAHTSTSSFDGSKFGYMGGIRTWSANTQYNVGEIVKYEDNLYYVTTAHNSGESFAFTNFSFLNVTRLIAWTANKQYPVGSIVLANGIVYYANESHKSSATFGADKSKWVALSGNIQSFVQNRYYPVGSTVVHNGKLYKAILENDGRTDPALGYYWEEISNRGITPWQPRTNNLHVNNIGSLLHFERTVTFDEVFTNTWQIELSAGLTTSDAKFGNSCYAAGNWFGRYIHNNTNIVEILGSNDITQVVATIEFWAKLETSLATIFELKALDVYSHFGTGDIQLPESFGLNKWNHFAFVLNAGTTYRAFVNGEDCGEYPINHPEMPIMDIRLGRIDITDAYTWIDEFCVTQEVKYTEAFTPPEEPFVLGKYGYYEVDDYVSYDNKIYRCVTRNADQTFDRTKWELMYSDMEVLRDWESDKPYRVGSLVIYNTRLYRCHTAHTSGSTFDGSKWTLVNSAETWTASTYYPEHILCVFEQRLYRCTTAHTSGETFDTTKWELMGGKDLTKITNHAANVDYRINDVIMYNSELYRCTADYTSTATFDSTKWELVKASIQTYTASIPYKVGQTTIYGGMLYRCTTAHTSTATFDPAKWELIGNIKTWATSTPYKARTVVVYNGNLYMCTTDHTSGTFNTDVATKWLALNQNAFIPNWASSTEYRQNQLVMSNGVLLRAKETHTSSSSFLSDSAKWELVNANILDYVNGRTYLAGEYVIYNNALYRCKDSHTSVVMPSEHWELVLYNIAEWGTYRQYDPNIKALLHFDTSATKDELGNSWINKSCDYTTSYKKFGTGCLNTGGWYPDVTIQKSLSSLLGEPAVTAKYTLEWWVMTTDSGLASQVSYYLNSFLVEIPNNLGNISFSGHYKGIPNCVVGKWHHVAVVVNGLDTVNYVDGVNIGTNRMACAEPSLTTSSINNGVIRINGQNGVYMDEFCVTKGLKYTENFTPSDHAIEPMAVHKKGQLCIHDKKLYRALADIEEEEFTESNWELIGGSGESSSSVVTTWTADTAYLKNQLIENNSKLYIVANNYTSGQTIETDIANKNLVPVSAESDSSSISNWESNKEYKLNDIVIYDYSLYECTTAHTSGTTFDSTKWHVLGEKVKGVKKTEVYTSNTYTNTSTTISTPNMNKYDYITVTYEVSNDGQTSICSNTEVIAKEEDSEHQLTVYLGTDNYMVLNVQKGTTTTFSLEELSGITHYKISSIEGFTIENADEMQFATDTDIDNLFL